MVGVTVPGYGGSLTHVSSNNITIVGKGKGKTTMLGGFYVKSNQNVKIEQLWTTYTLPVPRPYANLLRNPSVISPDN